MPLRYPVAALILALANSAVAAEPVTVKLADGGQALLPVVVAEKATAETKASAAKLADYLGRIAGAQFAVETGVRFDDRLGRIGMNLGCQEQDE